MKAWNEYYTFIINLYSNYFKQIKIEEKNKNIFNQIYYIVLFNSLIITFLGFEFFYYITCLYLYYMLSLSLGKFKNFISCYNVYGVTPCALNK